MLPAIDERMLKGRPSTDDWPTNPNLRPVTLSRVVRPVSADLCAIALAWLHAPNRCSRLTRMRRGRINAAPDRDQTAGFEKFPPIMPPVRPRLRGRACAREEWRRGFRRSLTGYR